MLIAMSATRYLQRKHWLVTPLARGRFQMASNNVHKRVVEVAVVPIKINYEEIQRTAAWSAVIE